MGNSGFLSIQIVTSLTQLVLGAVALTLVCLWTPQRGKPVLIAMVATMFVAMPVIELAVHLVTVSWLMHQQSVGYRYGQGNGWFSLQSYQLMMFGAVALAGLLQIVGSALLVAYVAVRRREASSLFALANGDKTADGSSEMHSVGGSPPLTSVPAAVWETNLDSSQHVRVARRREWAHVLDCLPAILFVFVSILISSAKLNWDRGSQELTSGLIGAIGFLGTPTFLAYLLFKDSLGGVSVGKWITGCRVVDAKSGVPASVGQSIVRNLIFLLIPIGSLIELLVVNFRSDRRRLGDHWAGTMVVSGSPKMVDGLAVEPVVDVSESSAPIAKHPLDD